MNSYVYKLMELSFPSIVHRAVEFHELHNGDIEITTDDGSKILYDWINNDIRDLPKDRNNLTEEECRKEFGQRLYNIMRRKGILQSDLSEMTGIPQPQISNYITGKSLPSFYNTDKIAKALKCSLDDLRYF